MTSIRHTNSVLWPALVVLSLLLASCAPVSRLTSTPTVGPTPNSSPIPTLTAKSSPEPTAPPTTAATPTLTAAATPSPTAVVATGSAIAVAAGGEHTCALSTEGGVRCWGDNDFGQLGDGSTIDSLRPVDVGGLQSDVRAIAAHFTHTCALTSGGSVKCWGQNDFGQLGNGSTIDSATPVDVLGLAGGAIAISAGDATTCALTRTGGVKCWGWNGSGQLGDGSTIDSATPVDVLGLANGATAIAAGDAHTCAVTSIGSVACWGENAYGQLGNGSTTDSLTPVNVSGLRDRVTAIALGHRETCALTIGGSVKCWGDNSYGQLGDGSTTDRMTPVDVLGLAGGVTAISAGYYHICALTGAGGVRCWGESRWGQLGNGSIAGSATPVEVSGLVSGVIAISASAVTTCAVTSRGGVKCWGRNFSGQLGDGSTTDSTTPVDVLGLTSGVAVLIVQ